MNIQLRQNALNINDYASFDVVDGERWLAELHLAGWSKRYSVGEHTWTVARPDELRHYNLSENGYNPAFPFSGSEDDLINILNKFFETGDGSEY